MRRKRAHSGFLGSPESFASKNARIFSGALALFLAWVAFSAATVYAAQKPHAPCSVIVVGYVGGLDFPTNPYSGIVQIRERLKKMDPGGLCVETFSAYTWWRGYDWLMNRLKESVEAAPAASREEGLPRIVIYGHSLGGWATVSLSRRLAAKNIPVELTVQVDSVGFTDGTVPSNVKQAANYFRQAVLPPYGRHKISAKDSGSTEILGNFYVPHANHLSVTQASAISDLIVLTATRLSAAAK